jgi:hypothetical protein
MHKYSPKVGDVVTAEGMNPEHQTFQVIEAPNLAGSTKIQPFSLKKQILFGNVISVPRSVLRLFKEDASQAAARIVKEATENH